MCQDWPCATFGDDRLFVRNLGYGRQSMRVPRYRTRVRNNSKPAWPYI